MIEITIEAEDSEKLMWSAILCDGVTEYMVDGGGGGERAIEKRAIQFLDGDKGLVALIMERVEIVWPDEPDIRVTKCLVKEGTGAAYLKTAVQKKLDARKLKLMPKNDLNEYLKKTYESVDIFAKAKKDEKTERRKRFYLPADDYFYEFNDHNRPQTTAPVEEEEKAESTEPVYEEECASVEDNEDWLSSEAEIAELKKKVDEFKLKDTLEMAKEIESVNPHCNLSKCAKDFFTPLAAVDQPKLPPGSRVPPRIQVDFTLNQPEVEGPTSDEFCWKRMAGLSVEEIMTPPVVETVEEEYRWLEVDGEMVKIKLHREVYEEDKNPYPVGSVEIAGEEVD